MYRYIRDHLANPEMLKIDYPEVLEAETVGMAFPIDSNFFKNLILYMVTWI